MSLSLSANTVTANTITNISGVTFGVLNVSGTLGVGQLLTSVNGLYSYIKTPVSNATVSTTNYLTLPEAGVYFVLVSQTTVTASSSSIELIDNLTRVCMVICSTLSSQNCQIYNLGNSSSYFSLSSSGQFTINLTVSLSSGQYMYRSYYQKIF